MITVEEAKELVMNAFKPQGFERISLSKALNRVLFADIFSPISMPPFRQSAMDGYALRLDDVSQKLKLQGVVKAGDTEVPTLLAGHALRIFTGAMVPDTADIVVMQEKVEVENDKIVIKDSNLKSQMNVRSVGEQIKMGSIAVKKRTVLSPGVIGFIASLGITEVEVVKKPNIALAITGDELIQPGNSLLLGQVYESNSITIQSAAESTGYNISETVFLKDNFEETKSKINRLISNFDALIITGGISVGDYDFVWKSLQELGCEVLLYKVKQKPGKPLLIGKVGNCSVFALPGNPYAALSCYYQYVLTALDLLSGKLDAGLKMLKLPLSHDYTKKGDRAEFLKAKVVDGKVTVLSAQASSMLSAFTDANAQVYIPWDVNELREGERVKCYLF